MDAISLGPVVLALPRLYAALALGLLVLSAELMARRLQDAQLSNWAWAVLWIVLLGARAGFVLENAAAYAREPLSILYFWQGGFSPLWGLVAAGIYSLWVWRGSPGRLRAAALPAGLSLVLWLGLTGLHGAQPTPSMSLPELTLERLDGRPLALSHLAGKPVVINLWATWCFPCRREMPLLVETAAAHPQVHFVLASQGEAAGVVAAYLQETGLPPELVALDRRGSLGLAVRSQGLPTTLFFGADGQLVDRFVGELSRAALNNYLARLER